MPAENRCDRLVNFGVAELDYVMMTRTGMPDMDRHWDELKLFAKEVMLHFTD